MRASVQGLSGLRAIRAGRGAYVLGASIVCILLAGCGSSTHSTASQTSSESSSTAVQTSTSTTTTTTTSAEADVSGKLDTLPQAAPATGMLPAAPSSTTAAAERSYLTAVFNDAQRFWQMEFSGAGVPYAPARLTLFTRAVHSGCGAQADVGPFYCPANRTVYLDLSFFELLARHAGIGPFGPAYIVGHELGHHVQHLLGIAQRVAALDQQNPGGANARSVRVELQADCLAGVWAHSSQARGQLTETDLGDALKTATFVGDDFQQHAAGRAVDSALWTHGSAAQRQHWLTAGFESGRPSACDTFANPSPSRAGSIRRCFAAGGRRRYPWSAATAAPRLRTAGAETPRR
jgi:predicted metalloprotease